MSKHSIVRWIKIIGAYLLVAAVAALGWLWCALPEQVYLEPEQPLMLPRFGWVEPLRGHGSRNVASTRAAGSYQTTLALGGWLPVKIIRATVMQRPTVTVCGTPFGVKMFSEGALVVGFSEVHTAAGTVNPAKQAGLRLGDRVIRMGNTVTETNEQVHAALEAAAGAVVLVLLGAKGCPAAGITLPGVGYVDLGIAAPLLWEGLLVALAECARIADGMDGIVCGASFAAMLGLMGVMTLLGWFPLGVLPAALAGSLMAFLLWNFPPAKLRLGSVGSLFLAGMLGCVPLCIGWPDLTLPLALPFWLEGGMVALQILVCKASRGRRQLFRSAPLHRWLELRGQSAEQIFYTFCVIAMLGVALTVQLAKIS